MQMNVASDFLSYITPDPNYPNAGIVRMTNNTIQYIAKAEGFIEDEVINQTKIISDEERLVVKIMFHHHATILLKRKKQNEKQLIMYFHQDGIISCENETSDRIVFHCFSNINDLLVYHINDFISADYKELEYPFHFLVPTDGTLYKEPHHISYSQKLKNSVLKKLKASSINDSRRFHIEKNYIEEWDKPKFTIQLHANNENGEIGFLSFLFCENCIWAVYPYEKDCARVKVMGSAEAQNKFCEFITVFSDKGDT